MLRDWHGRCNAMSAGSVKQPGSERSGWSEWAGHPKTPPQQEQKR